MHSDFLIDAKGIGQRGDRETHPQTCFCSVTIPPLKRRGMFDFWGCVCLAMETQAAEITTVLLTLNWIWGFLDRLSLMTDFLLAPRY